MPKTKFQSIIFTALMVFCMVFCLIFFLITNTSKNQRSGYYSFCDFRT